MEEGKHHMGKLLQFLVTDATKEDVYMFLVQEAGKPNRSRILEFKIWCYFKSMTETSTHRRGEMWQIKAKRLETETSEKPLNSTRSVSGPAQQQSWYVHSSLCWLPLILLRCVSTPSRHPEHSAAIQPNSAQSRQEVTHRNNNTTSG